ncbi:MAG: hypothetical protein R8K54_05960 [Mariprofundaceae bacterium]
MPDSSESVTSLSIARHAVQFILRLALDAKPKRCFGLIGQKSASTISHAASLPDVGTEKYANEILKNRDLQHILEKWTAQKIRPCGIFFTTENGKVPDYADMKKLEDSLKKSIPEFIGKPIIYLPLMLNTAGCLETFAYLIGKGSLVSTPLILEEDGQQRENG